MNECLLFIKIKHSESKIQDLTGQLFWSRIYLPQTYGIIIVGFELKFQFLYFKIFWAVLFLR